MKHNYLLKFSIQTRITALQLIDMNISNEKLEPVNAGFEEASQHSIPMEEPNKTGEFYEA